MKNKFNLGNQVYLIHPQRIDEIICALIVGVRVHCLGSASYENYYYSIQLASKTELDNYKEDELFKLKADAEKFALPLRIKKMESSLKFEEDQLARYEKYQSESEIKVAELKNSIQIAKNDKNL